jgi:molybdenum cofactor cytidylyltransferase
VICNSVVGVYLAAGKSSRMGTNKLELSVGETCLGSMGFQAALESKLDFTIAITRKEDPLQWLDQFKERKGWGILQCHQADIGQSASLKAGVKAAIALNAGAIVVLLGDQPLITSRIINQLVDCKHSGFAASTKKGVIMPPILFSQTFFRELLHLNGDEGARRLLRGKGCDQGILVEIDHDLMMDVDTEKDYQNLLKMGRDRT